MTKPLRDRDFVRTKQLSAAFFRATNPHLDAQEFALKWANATQSGLRFFRSFAQAWHLTMLDVDATRVPTGRCWCFGDAHLENFGVMSFREGPAYVCNDLDDAGPALAAVDVLRYFTSLGLAAIQPAVIEQLIEHYVVHLFSSKPAQPPPRELWPQLVKDDQIELARWCKNDGFRFAESELQLREVSAKDQTAIVRTLHKSLTQEQYTVRAIAQRQRDGGGSGGLERFLVLVNDGAGVPDLLEFKETTRAATAWGNQLREPEDRLERAIKELWRGLTVKCFKEVVVGRRRFLLRSRLGRAKLAYDSLKRKDRDAVLMAQVELIAQQHREALKAHKPKVLSEWLAESSPVLIARWQQIYEQNLATEDPR